ncbi:MAG TPA: 1-acyl-sn-glycerol-3-phosphate acyltransferase [Bacteroidales bacterium]|jgi:1-acyl-sn-glycerol-3-phosphate acyltransferase|nr:1-acyl-sn-glycerol-3-phosphate acyltransferase [Bacteroidales bacterium]
MKIVASFLYQWIVFIPLFLVLTLITALVVMIMAPIFGSRFWGYQPPKWWSRFTCWLALCCIKTSGHEHLDPKQSYVFVANHQSAFDIFLIYGFLRHPIIWMQKKSLRSIPFVGFASEKAGHVFVDNSSVAARAATIEKAKEHIIGGISMVIFPEGARTRTGKMGRFKRGAYQIAHDMKLPIVPLTLNGPFEVLKRNSLRLCPGKRMELIIHPPIQTDNLSKDELPELMEQTRDIIHGALWEKYR